MAEQGIRARLYSELRAARRHRSLTQAADRLRGAVALEPGGPSALFGRLGLVPVYSRLAALDTPVVLVSHWPLLRAPTRVLRHPEFAVWCGTELTAGWHRSFPVTAAVYGHLHIPRTTVHDGVRFEEVSVGYPREWQRRGLAPPQPRVILG